MNIDNSDKPEVANRIDELSFADKLNASNRIEILRVMCRYAHDCQFDSKLAEEAELFAVYGEET